MADDSLATPDAIRKASLAYGSWRNLKALYKRLEADPGADVPRLGALIARLDVAEADPSARPKALNFKNMRYLPHLATADGKTLWAVGGDGWRERRLSCFSLDAENLRLSQTATTENVDEPGFLVASGRFAVTGESSKKGVWLIVWEAVEKSVKRKAAMRLDGEDLLGLVECSGLLVALTGGKNPELHVFSLDDQGVFTARSKTKLPGVGKLWGGSNYVVVRQNGRGLSLKGLPQPEGICAIDLIDPARPKIGDLVPIKNVDVAVGSDGFVAVLAGESAPYRTCHAFVRDGERLQATGNCRVNYVGVDAKAYAVGRSIVYASSYSAHCFRIALDGKPVAERWRVKPEGAIATGNGTLVCAGNWRGGHVWQLPQGFPDAAPVLLGSGPSAATIGYMKRRTRRLLKTLAKTDPARYVTLAYSVLSASAGFDPAKNWALAEILLGGGGRLGQTAHGRGPVFVKPGPKLNLRRREELCPDAWDARPELAERLYADPKAGWAARELAARQLRVRRQKLPAAPDAALVADLASPSLLLNALALRQVVGRESISPALLGVAWFRAGRAAREKLTTKLSDLTEPKPFVNALWERIGDDGPLSARQRAALNLLATRFPSEAVKHVPQGRIVYLLDGGGALRELALARLRAVKSSNVEDWLRVLEGIDDLAGRETALDVLATVFARDPRTHYWRWRLFDERNSFLRAAWWRFLAANDARKTVAAEVWRELLGENSLTAALRTAMTSPHALALLAEFVPAEEFQAALQSRPFLVEALDAQTFKTLAQTLPLDAVLRLASAASDESWNRLRGGLLENLTEGVRLLPFWQAVEVALSEPGGDALETRLLNADDFAATFLALDDGEAVLAIRAVAFGELLGRWMERNRASVGNSERLRLLASTHPLAEPRAIGLGEVGARPLHLAFALHLLESEVPAAATLGQGFFDRLLAGDAQETTAALALCDSPVRSVRARGRAFVTARSLAGNAVLTALLENDDPEVQDFVAEAGATMDAPIFDASVLRTRRRARRAKEKIKTRQEARPTMETDALLALARQTSSPRDAEWALGQLARRALAGETIEGLEIVQ